METKEKIFFISTLKDMTQPSDIAKNNPCKANANKLKKKNP